METKGSPNLLEAITRISYFSYEPSIAKYSFLKDYLEKKDKPKEEWVLWMTAAGVGYALSTKEAYPGEHDELLKSIEEIDDLPKIVESFAVFIQNVYKNKNELYPLGIGFWVITKIKDEKPTVEEANGLCLDIGEILSSTIQDFEAEKAKNSNGD